MSVMYLLYFCMFVGSENSINADKMLLKEKFQYANLRDKKGILLLYIYTHYVINMKHSKNH